MSQSWLVKCLDARYDEECGMIVSICFFEALKRKGIIYFNKTDFHQTKETEINGEIKKIQGSVEHFEMYKMAALLKDKTFSIIIEDDPNRDKAADDPNSPAYAGLVREFNDRIGQELDAVTEGLTNEDKLIARRVADIVKEDHVKQGKLSADEILAKEFTIRAKLDRLKSGDDSV